MKRLLRLSMLIVPVCLIVILVKVGYFGDIMQTADDGKSSINRESSPKSTIKMAIPSIVNDDIIEGIIKSYNDRNMGSFSVGLTKIADDKYEETLNLLMNSGNGPDIFRLSENMIMTYIYKDWLADLKPYINNEFLEAMPEWAVKYAMEVSPSGKLYTFPSNAITTRLIYNKDLFKRAGLNPETPPKTLSELREYAKRISNREIGSGRYGFAISAGDQWSGYVQAMETPATCSGIYYFDDKKGTFDLSGYKPWLTTFVQMKKEGGLFPGENSLKRDTALRQFEEGNVGMMFASSEELAFLTTKLQPSCDWGAAMPPATDEESIGKGNLMIYLGCYGINSDSQNKAAAIEVWKFLNSKEFQGEQFELSGDFPVIKEILVDLQYKPSIKNIEYFIPTVKETAAIHKPEFLNNMYRMDAYAQIMEEAAPIDETLKKETDRLNNMYKTN